MSAILLGQHWVQTLGQLSFWGLKLGQGQFATWVGYPSISLVIDHYILFALIKGTVLSSTLRNDPV